jgi:hypothetical protein
MPAVETSNQQGVLAPGSLITEALAVVICMIVLSTLFLALRQWVRFGIQHVSMGIDDWTIIVAWVFTTAYGIAVCICKCSFDNLVEVDDKLNEGYSGSWLQFCYRQ